ncbi:threonine--tRNA ligase [Candidatus Peregrinibacteria bacterium]|nr:threonine--tRNA ligase [Candidatus Peregrinibacteria bacterium]
MPSQDKSTRLYQLRHSCSHVLAQAVMEMFPEAKLGFGPPIENGFYYDFDLPRTLIPEDLAILEEKMRRITKEKQTFLRRDEPAQKAIEFLKKADQPYKVELVEDLAGKGEKIVSFYENIDKNGKGRFVDLCEGNHAESTGEIKVFKLLNIAGAYWRGDEKNKMLQRIYGTCFETKEELAAYLKQLEEAKKRDHRKLGKELKLFTFSDYVGPGLPLWLPNGTVIVEELEKLAKETERRAGYKQVRTPHIAKEIMYKTSGHLPYYAPSMFPPLKIQEDDGREETYYLKAMNCPHHHQIYASSPRSYRDLPLRLAEYGTCYRYEKSGELFGLMRVRMLSMNDAHIYCTEEQFESEFKAVNDMYLNYFKLFSFKKYIMRFSTHDKKGLGKKYMDDEKLWLKTEEMVRKVLINSKINYEEIADEAAFYGPKIDVQVWSSIGREFTIATNQVDFAIPRRFGLTYTDKDGKEATPICIHRAPLGTHERFIGFLIEHYGGAFPLWLAPVQIRILPVSDKFLQYAHMIEEIFAEENYRVEVDDSAEGLGKKIRNAELQKIPYMVVVGEKEEVAQTINIRDYATKKQEVLSVKEFLNKLKK